MSLRKAGLVAAEFADRRLHLACAHLGFEPGAAAVHGDVALAASVTGDLAAGKQPKIGPQVERKTSCPEGGPTTLREMVEENHDYRDRW